MAEISKTADLALRVLLELGRSGPVSVGELARSLQLNRTVVHRILATLQGRGFVLRSGGEYSLGPVLIRLAESIEPRLRAAARTVMEETAGEIGETIVLHVRADLDAVVLDQVVGERHVVRVQHELGSRHPLTLGASGRAILAFSDPKTVEQSLAAAADPARVQRQLESVREAGYSVSQDELQLGVCGVAAPVATADGQVNASLGILLPSSRSDVLNDYAHLAIDAAARVATLADEVGEPRPFG